MKPVPLLFVVVFYQRGSRRPLTRAKAPRVPGCEAAEGPGRKPVGIYLLIGYVYAQEPRQGARIQYLISSVEALEGARFLRNGREYDVKAAADHLRFKLRVAGDQVKTADDFIRLRGSKSSVSGELYRIRFSDGTTVEAEVFFATGSRGLEIRAYRRMHSCGRLLLSVTTTSCTPIILTHRLNMDF